MKKASLLALSFIPLFSLAQQTNFLLKGKVNAPGKAAKVYLIYSLSDRYLQDSCLVSHGTFQFKGNITEPHSAQLILDHQGVGLKKLVNQDKLSLYLQSGNIFINAVDSLKRAKITGSPLTIDDQEYTKLVAVPEKQMNDLNTTYYAASAERKNDKRFIDSLQASYYKAKAQEGLLLKQFIKQKPDSYIGLVKLVEFTSEAFDHAVVLPIFNELSASLKKLPTGIELEKQLVTAKATEIGALAPVFTQNDVNDKPLSISAFRGKYVLLDIWASWCVPCRNENPNVVNAFHRYKDKNFTVFGVSLDGEGKKANWLAAIKADGLEWAQVSDLQSWNNAAAKLYGVKSIPQNFLIDPDGKIIAKSLRGEELMAKLASILE